MDRFGGFDTWVNNAGVSIWGRLMEVTDEDNRRLFDTNFWGVVHGSTIAAAHLRREGRGASSTSAAWRPTWPCRSRACTAPASTR